MIKAELSFVDKKQNVIQYEEERTYGNIKEAVEKVKDEFCIKGRVSPVLIDTKKGTKKVGFIKNTWGQYDDDNKRFPLEIWVSFFNITPYLFS